MAMVEVSIILPAYNEEKRIGETLEGILEYLKKRKFTYEIIVVDDGSKDNTIKVVKKFKDDNIKVLKNDPNRGKGYSVKRGILEAKYPLVLFSDSDLATPIEELDKFLEYIDEGYDIVIASRLMKGSNIVIKQPFYRVMIGSFRCASI
jgi:dolichyl-phosphate beta-glucosyltransferase